MILSLKLTPVLQVSDLELLVTVLIQGTSALIPVGDNITPRSIKPSGCMQRHETARYCDMTWEPSTSRAGGLNVWTLERTPATFTMSACCSYMMQ